MEPRIPAIINSSIKIEGKGVMIKALTTLQNLRKKIYIKGKTEKFVVFFLKTSIEIRRNR